MKGLSLLPKGTNVNLEEAGDSFHKISRLFGLTLSCNYNLSLLGELFSGHAYAAFVSITTKISKKIMYQVYSTVQEAECQVPDDDELLEFRLDRAGIPVDARVQVYPPIAVLFAQVQTAGGAVGPADHETDLQD